MNLIKEHLPLLLMHPYPEKENPVLHKHLSRIRLQHVDTMHIFIGMGSCGIIAGAKKLKERISKHIETHNINAKITDVGCIGLCSEEPIIDIQIPGRTRISFSKVSEESVSEIIDAISNNFLPEANILGQYENERLLDWEDVPYINNHSFLKPQNKILTQNCGIINPNQIDDAIANKAYTGFIKAITSFTSKEVCQLVLDAKLRGRSGSAYLTGRKWLAALEQASSTKYLICNADESDPGSFVDKHLAEGDPHQIIEGLCIAAYAIQANKAIIYIRNQYQLATSRLKNAIKQAYEYKLLGDNIFNSGFNLDISIKIGAGAYVCGEETALIASLEGKRGMPETKPPFPVEKGLFGKPTVVNNLETLVNIPHILKNGADWFINNGTKNSTGTKLFSISGKIARTGVVEFNMGTRIRSILQTAGGVPGDPDLKAVHIGGPSGGMTNTNHIDLPIDYEELEKAGLRMGSGSILVLDEKNCILNLIKYFMRFNQQESCGKCIPCREGTQRLLEILERITQKPNLDIRHESLKRFKGVMQLESLATLMQETSLCGLGQHAANSVISGLRYFREDFEEHIFDKKCKAGVCKGLKSYIINVDICIGCTICAQKCPVDAIIGTARNPYFIVQEKCIGCGECYEHCKFNAISII